MEVCCSPNTVSKFIRFFPKFAALFIVVHIILLILTSLNETHNVKVRDVKQIRNLSNDLDVLKVDTLDVNKESNNILDEETLHKDVKDPRLRRNHKA